MKLTDDTHPADELGKALSQARGIVSSLINCFDKAGANFVTGQTFVAEAMIAVEDLLSRAGGNLASLYENYDLTLVGVQNEDEVESKEPDPEPEVDPEPEQSYQPSSFGLFGRHHAVSHLANKLDTIVETMPKVTAREPMRPEQMMEQPAQSYEELLDKLTAMADSAAYHTHASKTESTLLPVLESLRADVMRLRSVA